MTPTLTRGLQAAALALTLLLGVQSARAETTTWKVDLVHSTVAFRVKHLGISHTHGRFNAFAGTFCLDDEDLSKARVSIEVDVNSIDTNNGQRDEHLKAEDYFHAEAHPKMTFESTRVEKVEGGYRVTGDLTLRGVRRSVVLRMTKVGEGETPFKDYRIGFDGGMQIRRSEFGMQGGLPMVGDEVDITLAIEAIRQ